MSDDVRAAARCGEDRFLNLRETNAECAIALHESHRALRDASFWGSAVPRHFVPGYDRSCSGTFPNRP
jgi:hypothetical protein